MRSFIKVSLLLIAISSFVSCKQSTRAQNPGNINTTPQRNLSSQFKNYWYEGTAEISTYELSENRYGELREGKATLIYVTEDFVSGTQVKADRFNSDNNPVLKLNSVKKFITGVYPYSIMQSSFLPLQNEAHATKITTTVQEWCGQSFIQLNNRDQFEINAFSYFESEGDQQLKIAKNFTENELWNLIRLEGLKGLPIGDIDLIPSFEYIRLNHHTVKAYPVKISSIVENNLVNYTIHYPDFNRTLTISFQEKFPYIVQGWKDQTDNKQPNIAKRITTKKLPYWKLNSKKDEILRNEFGL